MSLYAIYMKKHTIGCPICNKELRLRMISSLELRLYCSDCKDYFKTKDKKRLIKETKEETDINNFLDLMFNFRGSPKIDIKVSDYLTQSSFIKKFDQFTNMKKKLKSIRYLFHGTKNDKGLITHWSYHFNHFIYHIDSIGDQFVDVLNKYHFISGKYDQFLIYFTPKLNHEEINITKHRYYVTIEYGINPEMVKSLNHLDIILMIKEATLNVFKHFYKDDVDQINILNQANLEFMMVDHNPFPIIPFLQSRSDHYVIKITYQITNKNNNIVVFLYIKDMLQDIEGEFIYLELMNKDDTLLIDSINIENDEFIILPKDRLDQVSYNRFNIDYFLNKSYCNRSDYHA